MIEIVINPKVGQNDEEAIIALELAAYVIENEVSKEQAAEDKGIALEEVERYLEKILPIVQLSVFLKMKRSLFEQERKRIFM